MTGRMFGLGIPLAQVRPAAAGVFESLVAGSTNAPRIEVTRIVIVNTTASAATFRLCHDIDGTAYDQASALHWDTSVAANSTLEIVSQHPGGGLAIGKTGNLAFASSIVDALTCTVYGVSADVQGQDIEGAR